MRKTEFLEPVILAHSAPFRLGTLAVDPARCVLRTGTGQERLVEPRVMQVLIALVRAQGEPVTRDELLSSCWGGRHVGSDAVSRVISMLRTLAQDAADGSFTVETLTKVGYRLIERPVADEPQRPATPLRPAILRRPEIPRRVVIATAAAICVSAAGALRLRHGGVRAVASSPVGPAVLIVMPATADPADHALLTTAQNMTASMREDFADIPGLHVVSGLASAAVAGQRLAPQQIAARTGATLALATNLDRAGDAIRAMVTLSDLASGQLVWSAEVAMPDATVADLARDAAGAVTEQLVLRLPITAARPADAALRGDPEAYRLCKEAHALCDQVRERFIDGDADLAHDLADRAANRVRRALALQDEYAPALVVLADLARNGWSRDDRALPITTQQRVDRAHGLLRRALRSDPANSAAMSGLANIYRRFGWRWDDAETFFRHALVNDPSNADAHWAYSHQLATLGRAEDALSQTFALAALDWKTVWRRITLPRMLYLLGLRDQALACYYAELGARPGNPFLLWEIYYLHAAERSADGLRRLAAWLTGHWAGLPMPAAVDGILARVGAALAALHGEPAALVSILDAERAQLDAGALSKATLGGRARDDINFILALEYASARNYDTAIVMLDQALAAKSLYWVAALPYGNAPFPAAMLGDPRFQALWRRDPQLVDVIDRRRQAARQGQMAAVWPDGRRTMPQLLPATLARVEQAVTAFT